MTTPATSSLHLPGISSLISLYDGFLLDQWGVLHDGTRAYEGASEALGRMRDAGKPVIILSNSGRTGEENALQLAHMGFGRDLYDKVISAGDDARAALRARDEPFYRALGKRCLLLAREGEEHLAEGLDLDVVSNVEKADFILLMTMDAPRQSLAGWRLLLQRSRALGLPMICGNPDLHRASPDGGLQEAPGSVARAYEMLGGRVRYHGKPEPRIYRHSLATLGLDPSRVLALGDSLLHDIAGAHAAGIASALIASGIHCADIEWIAGMPTPESCEVLFQTTGFVPAYVLPSFGW